MSLFPEARNRESAEKGPHGDVFPFFAEGPILPTDAEDAMETAEMMQYAAHATYLYTAVFLVLGTLGLPIPEEIILLVAGYLAGTGAVNIWLIMPYTSVLVVVADNGIYFAARKLGRGFIKKWGRFIFIPEERLRKIEVYVERHGNKTVFFSRFLIGFRSTGIIIAGITKMPWNSFLLYDSLSVIVYLPIVVGLGYYFHYQLNMLLQRFVLIKHIVFFSIVALLFIWLIKQLISLHKTE